MGSLAKIVTSLQGVTNRLITQMATDSVYVLRAPAPLPSNNKGGSLRTYTPTTATPHDCFYAPIPIQGQETEDMRGAQNKPTNYHRFVLRSDVDVKVSDRLRLVSTRGVAQKDMEIIRVADPIGITREVIAIEEVQA